jgi:hypothetical protein
MSRLGGLGGTASFGDERRLVGCPPNSSISLPGRATTRIRPGLVLLDTRSLIRQRHPSGGDRLAGKQDSNRQSLSRRTRSSDAEA